MYFNNKIYSVAMDATNTESIRLSNLLSLELANYGITVTAKATNLMHSMEFDKLMDLSIDILAKNTIGQLSRPLFANWENRESLMTFNEIVVQILSYKLSISGNDLYDPSYMKNLRKNIKFDSILTIDVASKKDAVAKFKQISKGNTHRSERYNLKSAFGIFDTNDWIANTQARVEAMDSRGVVAALDTMKIAPHDVLRAFAYRRDEDHWNLPSDVKYDSMSYQERCAALEYLQRIDTEKLLETFGVNRGAWTRFFKHINLFNQRQFRNRFHDVIAYVHISRGSSLSNIPAGSLKLVNSMISEGIVENTGENLAYRTFASRVTSAVESKNYAMIETLMSNRQQYLLNNIATISNGVAKKHNSDFLTLCRNAVSNVKLDTLFSILQIDTKSKYRIIDSNGSTTVQEANYSGIIRDLQTDIENHIYEKYGFEGQVEFDDSISNQVPGFLSKNQVLTRGTKYNFSGERYLQFFMKWMEKNRAVDLDHSWLMFDKNNRCSEVAFYRQANSFIKHGGDLTRAPAPHGASEYSVIDLQNISPDVKFIAGVINNYTNTTFKDDCAEAYAGFMFSEKNTFNINRDHTRYDLIQPASVNIPFLIDVESKNVVIVDFNTRHRSGSIAASSASDILKVYEASKTFNKLDVKRISKILSGDSKKVEKVISADGRNGTLSLDDISEIFQ